MKIAHSKSLLPAFLIFAIAVLEFSAAPRVVAQTDRPPLATPKESRLDLQIPPGTILPVRLNRGLSSKNSRIGQPLTGRIMQDLPLPNGAKIPAGARILGTVIYITPPSNNTGASITFKFDQLEIHHERIALLTNLRALASPLEVQFAQIPETTPGFGTPYSWATTDQIGGDVVYGVGGPVTDHMSQPVGKGVFGGVLVHVRARPGSKCRGELDGEDRLQALWVFSADACGLYEIPGVTIAHAGRTQPLGEIILTAESGELKIRSASGMLLRVIR